VGEYSGEENNLRHNERIGSRQCRAQRILETSSPAKKKKRRGEFEGGVFAHTRGLGGVTEGCCGEDQAVTPRKILLKGEKLTGGRNRWLSSIRGQAGR